MIETMLHYHITKRQLRLLQDHLQELQDRYDYGMKEKTLTERDQILSRASIAGQQSMIEDLKQQLYEFELSLLNDRIPTRKVG